ncbi:tripartite tricarboxylate transporter TctB family protein [Natrononativus amylolyticus]|uniref:tripartite tricarboxylate transporter TctB family protein n=1 Tax=Natrononativus amylolyticus TaxID=2963434 RepID=UPI0020CE2344|nr:tripartite tricarboxylate transporter TctB family protein [Natrononativus amylolyticus]
MRLLRWELTSEHGLLLTLFVISAYMLVESFSFGSRTAALFPQLTAVATLLCVLLLLLQNYLPEPLRLAVAEPVDIFGGTSDEERDPPAEQPGDRTQPDPDTATSGGDPAPAAARPLDETSFTLLAIVAYVGGSYLIGMLWATPLFVAGYAAWFRLGVVRIVGLSVLSFVIVLFFLILLNTPVLRGVLT